MKRIHQQDLNQKFSQDKAQEEIEGRIEIQLVQALMIRLSKSSRNQTEKMTLTQSGLSTISTSTSSKHHFSTSYAKTPSSV